MTSPGTDEAIRGARVTITTPDFTQEYGTLTDEDGTFEFKDLPKGSYTVTAAKGGYVSLSYGQRGPGDMTRPIEVTGSQALAGIDVRLPRGGVISGRILDEFGEPLAEAMVQFSKLASQGSERRLMTVGRAIRTNDLGEFRAFGLPAGDYYVRASSIGATSSSGPAPTYYPGTGSLSSARRVRVGLGQQTDGLVFSVLPPRTARISGIVLDPEGQPVGSAFVSVHQNLALGRGSRLAISSVQTAAQPDGTFMVVGLEPGEYVLRARPSKAVAVTDLRSAISSVTVSEDIEGVTLVMSRGGRAQGQIVTEDGKAPQSLKPAEVRVTAAPAQLGSPETPRTGVVRDDWSFEVTGIHDVRRILAAPPAEWALKSVMHDGQDVTDRPIDFGATSRCARVDGTRRRNRP